MDFATRIARKGNALSARCARAGTRMCAVREFGAHVHGRIRLVDEAVAQVEKLVQADAKAVFQQHAIAVLFFNLPRRAHSASPTQHTQFHAAARADRTLSCLHLRRPRSCACRRATWCETATARGLSRWCAGMGMASFIFTRMNMAPRPPCRHAGRCRGPERWTRARPLPLPQQNFAKIFGIEIF